MNVVSRTVPKTSPPETPFLSVPPKIAGVTVTPAVFGGTDRNGTSGADIFGAVVETTFKF